VSASWNGGPLARTASPIYSASQSVTSKPAIAAADRFRRERSVPTLVLVAASLDQLHILPW
jgi:hypothetical protein